MTATGTIKKNADYGGATPMDDWIGDLQEELDDVNLIKRELLANASFRIAQRGTSFTAASTPANDDDQVLFDRWVLLSDGNDAVDVSRDSDGSALFDAETANKQWAVCQILEEADCREIIEDGSVSIAFRAKSSGITKVRAAVLAWSGTADSPTTDVVSSWAGGGTEPTWATNWTREGDILDLTLSGSYQTVKQGAIALDTGGAVQFAVVVWVDDTTITVGDTLNLAWVSCVNADVYPTRRPHVPMAEDVARCLWFYQRFNFGPTCSPGSTSFVRFTMLFHQELRVAPTLALLDDSPAIFGATTGEVIGSSSSIASPTTTSTAARFNVDGFTGLTVGEFMRVNQSTDWLEASAEF